MADDWAFQELMRGVRSGDEAAAVELVRHYEPIVRCEARLRMTDPKLSRAFDSMDVCQSVLASFFLRAAAGQYDLEKPEQLVALLAAMVRNKVASRARKLRVRDADARRDESVDPDALVGGPDPKLRFEARELLAELTRRLSPEERDMANRRGDGQSWPEIAEALGGTAGSRRKQLARALDRAIRDIGLEDGDEGPDAVA